MNNRFNPKKLDKLNNPERLKDIPPEYIWQKLDMAETGTLVDIGAGTGFFSIPFQSLSGGKIYACDISETMINWMKKNITPDHPEIIPVQMKSVKVPLPDSSTDLVYMITLHHELEYPLENLREAHRLLRKGGKIFIVDWKKIEMQTGPSIDIRCTAEDVSIQLKDAGFRNISIDESLPKFFLIIGEN
ncbi:MAG: class I SAM-dependent methyltransferase [Spirochaetales bacterium]|nr:class I SAM-dependent methyltransferase [Spirochaetales bacterium]